MSGRLVILSGPSCLGKTPLHQALRRFYRDVYDAHKPVVLHNSRAPRPHEEDGVDYHFRQRDEIERLRHDPQYLVIEARHDLQALDVEELNNTLETGNAIFEGNPVVAKMLLTHEQMRHVNRLAIFVAPFYREEILFLKDEPNVSLEAFVADVIRRKLLRRTRRQQGELALGDLQDVERRATSAYAELKTVHLYDHVIPNHDGEDSDNWDAFYYPIGDARRALLAFVGILQGEPPSYVEHWEEGLLP